MPNPRTNVRAIAIAFLAVAVSAAVNLALNAAIPRWFPSRPVPPDLLFRITPMVGWLQYLADAAVVASPLLLAVTLLGTRRAVLPFVVTVFAVAELLRGLLMVLTPLGPSFGSMTYGLTRYAQYGQFPSGHTVMVAVAYLLAPNDPRWLKPTLFQERRHLSRHFS